MAAFVPEYLESRTLFSAAVVMTPSGLTPQQVRHAYQFDQVTFSKGNKLIAADGRGQTIAIVTAFHDPTVAADLRVFDKTFGLPNRVPGGPMLQIVHPQGLPPVNGSWAQETALDVEWAHAIAPGARLLLVEAKSEDPSDLFAAVDFARRRPSVGVISMSWGWDTAPAGVDYASILTTPSSRAARGNRVTFVEAAADDGVATAWPDLSVNVVSVGGTMLALDSAGQYAGETPLPQSASPALVAYNAAASPGYAVYDSVSYQGVQGWQTGDGTSAGAPQWAALFAIANQGRSIAHHHSLDGATQVRPAMQTLPSSDFHLVTAAGPTTGRGSPFSDRLIHDLVALA